MGGQTYTGRQMFELGGDRSGARAPGGARAAAALWMQDEGETKWRRRRTLAEARRRSHPITHEELIRITELWAELFGTDRRP